MQNVEDHVFITCKAMAVALVGDERGGRGKREKGLSLASYDQDRSGRGWPTMARLSKKESSLSPRLGGGGGLQMRGRGTWNIWARRGREAGMVQSSKKRELDSKWTANNGKWPGKMWRLGNPWMPWCRGGSLLGRHSQPAWYLLPWTTDVLEMLKWRQSSHGVPGVFHHKWQESSSCAFHRGRIYITEFKCSHFWG